MLVWLVRIVSCYYHCKEVSSVTGQSYAGLCFMNVVFGNHNMVCSSYACVNDAQNSYKMWYMVGS